jgi:hypothetical protein
MFQRSSAGADTPIYGWTPHLKEWSVEGKGRTIKLGHHNITKTGIATNTWKQQHNESYETPMTSTSWSVVFIHGLECRLLLSFVGTFEFMIVQSISLNIVHNSFTVVPFLAISMIKRQDSQGVAPLRKTDGFLHNDAPTKAEILNQQFHSVYTKSVFLNGATPYSPVASLSGMTKISLVHCVCHQARCHRCTCHGRFVILVVLLFSCVCNQTWVTAHIKTCKT